jgi:hypothetical protein
MSFFLRGSLFEMRRESRRDLCKEPVGENLGQGTHLPHVNRRAENKGIGMLNPVIKYLHVVVYDAATIPITLVAAQTTPARFDVKFAEIPGSSFGTLFFSPFEYFVYNPGGIALFPRACTKSDNFYPKPLHVCACPVCQMSKCLA